jgi:hypothetical protein
MRIWFLYLQDAFSKRETNIMFLLDSLKTLTILNVVPETASEFCPSFSFLPLVVSVFASLLTIGRFSHSRLTEQFSGQQGQNRHRRVSEEGY